MAKVCQICGKNSGIYPLCVEHLRMKADGKVVKCAECGLWHLADEKCKCKRTEYKELPTEGFDKCVICGEATTGYAFCRKCYKKYTREEMLDIVNGREVKRREPEKKTETVKETIAPAAIAEEAAEAESLDNVIVVDMKHKQRCITCGKHTDGLLFCPSCYQKYKDKELLFRITKCTNVELLEEDYEGKYTCKDGHVVKSKSERDIDNYLFEHGISHAYERELPYGAKDKEVLHPDFYLPNYLGEGKHVYIEHWGYNENNIQYMKTKNFKMPIYERLGITLICTYENTDMGKIDTVLDRKLNRQFIKENKINTFEE